MRRAGCREWLNQAVFLLVVAVPAGFVAMTDGVVRAEDCACVPCDFDHDGDVDQEDFGYLQGCFSGYGVPQTNPACLDARLAGHDYVDQQDLAIFRACLSGSGRPYPGTDLPLAAISEFMASNDSGLEDEDGDHPDWIEIYNPCQPALNLGGWFLTDDPSDLQKWVFPPVDLPRGEYLVVFASGKDRHESGSPLHTSFQLEKGGEYLALVLPDGETVLHSFAPRAPEQLTNVSYGLAQLSMRPVTIRAQAWYHVPTAEDGPLEQSWTAPGFPDGAWDTGQTGLGFSSLPTSFQVTIYTANVAVTSLATAEAVISDPNKRTSVVTSRASTVNFVNGGGGGHFAGDLPFPGQDISRDYDHFVVLATGSVVIPAAGEWTIGVTSDDGFGLTMSRGTQTLTASYPALRGEGDTLTPLVITEPGVYALRLVFFEYNGSSSVELYAAQGYHEAFSSAAFRLVGDAVNGGLTLGSLGADLATDVGPAMLGVNSSMWMRIPFYFDDPAGYTSVTLRMKYGDGLVAFLNGEEVARRNAPGILSWDAAATAARTAQAAAVYEEINLPGCEDKLKAGQNVLAIHGLNDAVSDGDFIILPELVISSNSFLPQYLPQPTPGEPNVPGVVDFVRAVEFDQQRGFRSAPFSLRLSCPTPGAEIRYTVDGSTPSEASGILYTGPITVGRTSVVRAAGFRPHWLPSEVMTHTYLFLSDIVTQSANGQAPAGWPSGWVSGQVLDYGMDPDIVNSTRYSSLIDDALLAIPSISLVTDLKHLFDPSTGIYTHASGDGEAWERPASVELIHPDGGPGFQINAGVRIRGGYSRSGDNPKHAFRLFFRAAYGQKSLEYPLFDAEGVSSFRKMDLRTDQNYSWSFGGDSRNTMIRDLFARDTQGAMGQPYTRSRYYHLYLDGQYWGIFETQERAQADFAASYLGGDADDYDVVKVDAGPYTIYATDGNMSAWYRLWQACQAGFSSDEAYYRVQGLNPDGSRNPDYEVLVDVDNTIDYNLLTFFTGDLDGPVSAFLGNVRPNNMYAIYNRVNPSGFKFMRHDNEHTLLNVNEDRTGPFSAGSEFSAFNPQYLHQRLAANLEYRTRFGDRVQKHMFNGGALTLSENVARFQARASQIDLAIIAESARWGDAKRYPPLNRNDHWIPEINWIMNTYFPQRNAVVLNQLTSHGWYPTVPAPLLSQTGGSVEAGFVLTLSKPSGASGTLYYTVDGSDPRLGGGAVSPAALTATERMSNVTFISTGSRWLYLDDGSNQGTAWTATDFADGGWKEGNAQFGYSPDEHDEITTVSYGSYPSNKFVTTYFRKSFDVPVGAACTQMQYRVLRDDGAVIYLNGRTPPATTNMPSSWSYRRLASTCAEGANETTYFAGTIDPSFCISGGRNVLAVEVHQCSVTSDDLSFDLELTGTLRVYTTVVIDRPMTVKARLYSNGQWSALVEGVFSVPALPLVVNEFMADNETTIVNPDLPGVYSDWIEVYNPNPFAVDMGGMSLTDDFADPARGRIPEGVIIPERGHLVFWADELPTLGRMHVNFKLSKGGDEIGLYAVDGVTPVDQVVFGAQTADVSYGRYPDGSAAWGAMAPTPGWMNDSP
ncbi:MAG TPA: lamin tail domain-containing protein [Phycisphaerae bacterium]|nr:lamin tail domain-containing protein [Phycisphaerae bacterium]HRY67444.1 lamin tail domain-containing protein [Phycisphaerae bacterium]HSA27963.1 lamin tail domain-containing protein [Phycisphaerae bacterium]